MEEQYERDSECEDYVDYGPQGYHPVALGERFNNSYTVIQKLGWGHFSTVWLVERAGQYYALKIQRSKQTHTESALDQLKMLQEIRRHANDPEWLNYLQQFSGKGINVSLSGPLMLLDNFAHHGIHGKHLCSVFELMGPNLLDVIQHYEFKDKRMPLWLVKKIARDVLLGLVYLHERCGIIHTDLKPENIMIKLEKKEEQELVSQLQAYKVKPLSMKYLKNIQTSKNGKNKKKNQKKKLKKKKLLEGGKQQEKQQAKQEEEGEQQRQAGSISNSSQVQVLQSKQNLPNSNNQSASLAKSQQSLVNPSQISQNQSSVINSSQQQSQSQSQIKPADDMSILKWKSVHIHLNDKLFFKIADMGNACFSNNHFTDDIQTRQYRSPEVLIGHDYQSNTDVWSLACTIFQMMTNNFLFKPKKIAGIKKDQDHLFQMIEMLGPIDKDYSLSGKKSSEFFNKAGKLLRGTPKKTIGLANYLIQKYSYDEDVAISTEKFLLPMLAYDPKDRVSARECLKSDWLWN